MNLSELAEAFKVARLRSRQTQAEVAAASGVGVLTLSKFERGALRELGVVKLIALLRTVGLDLQARPLGAERTLDDIARELDGGPDFDGLGSDRKRVRHSRKQAAT